MWSLTLAALAAVMVCISGQCPAIYEPLNKTSVRLEMSGPMTWTAVAQACPRQEPGLELLARDFLAADSTLCQGQAVPLGLFKVGAGPVTWTWNRHGYEFYTTGYETEVNATFLSRMRVGPDESAQTQHHVGSLDLRTRQWHLVANDSTFTCAVCMRTWTNWPDGRLNFGIPDRPKPFEWVYLVELQRKLANVSADTAMHLITQHFNKTVTLAPWVNERVNDPDRASLRIASTGWLNDSLVSEALNGSYGIESWYNADYCQPSRSHGIDWPQTHLGSPSHMKLPDFHVATRRCLVRTLADADYVAIWSKEVLFWVDLQADCFAQTATSLVRRLDDFAARPAYTLTLPSLVDITANISELQWSSSPGYYATRTRLSSAVLGALHSLLFATETGNDTSSACKRDACVFVTAQVQQSNDPVVLDFTRKDAPPSFVDPNASRSFAISLQIPSQITSASRVAVHTEQSAKFDGRLYFQTIEDLRFFRFELAAMVHVTSATPVEAWAVEGRHPLTFRVDNAKTYRFYRYVSVWRLDESQKSAGPCPLIGTNGSVDTFSCDMRTGGARNSTAGTFLAFSGIQRRHFILHSLMVTVFLGYTDIPVDASALVAVVELTSFMVAATQSVVDFDVDFRSLDLSSMLEIHGALERILNGVVLNDPFITVTRSHVKVLVSNLTVGDPVVGFSLDGLAGVGPVHTIAAGERNNVSSESAIDLVLGADVEQHCKQLAILAVSNFTDIFYPASSLRDFIKRKLMVVHLVATSKSAPDASLNTDVYFDIQVNRERMGYEEGVVDNDTDRRFVVATWSDEESDWSVSTCGKLRSTRASKLVFRCQLQLAIVGNDFHGKFLIFESFRFAEALDDAGTGA